MIYIGSHVSLKGDEMYLGSVEKHLVMMQTHLWFIQELPKTLKDVL